MVRSVRASPPSSALVLMLLLMMMMMVMMVMMMMMVVMMMVMLMMMMKGEGSQTYLTFPKTSEIARQTLLVTISSRAFVPSGIASEGVRQVKVPMVVARLLASGGSARSARSFWERRRTAREREAREEENQRRCRCCVSSTRSSASQLTFPGAMQMRQIGKGKEGACRGQS